MKRPYTRICGDHFVSGISFLFIHKRNISFIKASLQTNDYIPTLTNDFHTAYSQTACPDITRLEVIECFHLLPGKERKGTQTIYKDVTALYLCQFPVITESVAVSFQIRVIINSKARSSFAIFPCSVEQSSHPCTLTRSQFNVLPTNNYSRDRRMEFNETHPNSEIMYMYTDHTWAFPILSLNFVWVYLQEKKVSYKMQWRN